MKKSVIATGAASLALAAMPVVGVFAAGNTLTDHIEVNVPAACSITNANTNPNAAVSNLDNYYKKTIYNGQYVVIGASDTDPTHTAADNTVGVTCNVQSGEDAGWRLTAIGAGASGHETELWDGASNSINSAATPVTTTGGATSDWSFRVTISNNDNTAPNTATADDITSGSFHQIPDTALTVAHGTGSVAETTFTMDYGVYVSGTQKSGTYTGAVTYTLVNPAA